MGTEQTAITPEAGSPIPLGATVSGDGIGFSVFSRHATSVTLIIFQNEDRFSPYTEFPLDPAVNKTGDIWHIFLRGLKAGAQYGYIMDGPADNTAGHRFNKNRLLIDPYAKALTNNFSWDLSKAEPGNDESDFYHVPRAIAIPKDISIKNKVLNLPQEDSIVYELHVKGFTKGAGAGVEHVGTYKGLTEKIPYLKELGVTAVELLPVQEFDEAENPNVNPVTGQRLVNFWGYSTIAFFAPKASYSATDGMGKQINEFKEMVRALNEAGIEVILDVVFNHTGEGNHLGPTISFRGIDNSVYYMLDEDKRLYKNFSGCGNTFNCNHPLTRQFIMDCLRYWSVEIGVDGFRFDLAAILGRDQKGNILANSPIIELIEQDPILRHVKIIAEAWDAAGAYKLGDFPGRWKEWNGKYRDDMRRFWLTDDKCAGAFAARICGSEDLYKGEEKGPCRSINFVTCHDGFTLNDLVSYSKKHNEPNGENNRDGENINISCNHGVEGESTSPEINALRLKAAKNLIATLLLSRGIPMLTAGDEFLRTQKGNNNAYCQDNEISYVDWTLKEKNGDMFRFTKLLIAFRKAHPVLRSNKFFTGKPAAGHALPDIIWFGKDGEDVDWQSKAVALVINGEYAQTASCKPDNDICIIFNGEQAANNFVLPPAPCGRPWRLAVNTSAASPNDILEEGWEQTVTNSEYMAAGKSTAVFIA